MLFELVLTGCRLCFWSVGRPKVAAATVAMERGPHAAGRALMRVGTRSASSSSPWRKGGRTRADAERMTLRFRQGEQYFELLEESYAEASTPGRRGLLRPRKAID